MMDELKNRATFTGDPVPSPSLVYCPKCAKYHEVTTAPCNIPCNDFVDKGMKAESLLYFLGFYWDLYSQIWKVR
jgi:hypothetical protein